MGGEDEDSTYYALRAGHAEDMIRMGLEEELSGRDGAGYLFHLAVEMDDPDEL